MIKKKTEKTNSYGSESLFPKLALPAKKIQTLPKPQANTTKIPAAQLILQSHVFIGLLWHHWVGSMVRSRQKATACDR
jgi:hypothetical protein